MSAPAFAWALERGATLNLPPADRLVLLYLADMANGEKVCWPGMGLIETFTGLSPNTVRTALHRLSDMLLIRVETRPGYTNRYHILRDAPVSSGGNGGYQPPPNRAYPSPQIVPPPSPQTMPDHPPQIVPTTPPKPCSGGGHDLRLPPPNRAPDPSYTQEKKTLVARDAREAKQDFQIREEEEASTAPPSPPAPPPERDATESGADRPTIRSSDAWLDDPTPDDALPKAEADSLADDAPTQEAVAHSAARAIAELTRTLRMRAYGPGRPSSFTRNEMIDVLEEKPRIKPSHLPDAMLRAAREQLARRAGVLT